MTARQTPPSSAPTLLQPGVATVVGLDRAAWACGWASPAALAEHLAEHAPDALCAGGRQVDLSALQVVAA